MPVISISAIVTARSIYACLVSAIKKHCDNYRAFFDMPLNPAELDMVRSSLLSGTPIGNDKFKEHIESALGRKVGLAKVGRPRSKVMEAKRLGQALRYLHEFNLMDWAS